MLWACGVYKASWALSRSFLESSGTIGYMIYSSLKLRLHSIYESKEVYFALES
jgi:hypothetical protein